MAVLQGNAKQGSVRGFYPKTIEGSLRFNDDDSARLQWTPASAGNRKTWTISFWMKRSGLGGGGRVFDSGTNSDNWTSITFNGDDTLQAEHRVSDTTQFKVVTSAVLRDASAWYHIVVHFDTTQSTASNRLKLYINGEEASYSSTAYGSQNTDTYVNSTNTHYLGAFNTVSQFFDGYLAEVFFIDGTAHNADAFGETLNGIWVPKNITATDFTMGTNGFYLDFQDDTAVEAFNTITWRGDGSGTLKPRTGVGFAPDLVWIKNRDGANHHLLFDTVRGAGSNKELSSNNTTAEGGLSLSGYDWLSSFDSDGFTTQWSGSNIPYYTNQNGYGYVAWGWKAGGAPTVDNSAGAGNVPTAGSVKIDGVNSTSALAGTIPATRISASDTYGFSIVSYTGNGTAGATVGHGLSSAPDLVITHRRDSTSSWRVYHSALGATKMVELHTTGAAEVNGVWNNTAPTSSVFTLSSFGDVNTNTGTYIAYCWAETAYSKFGTYTGTGSSQTITTTFKPAMVIIKATSTTGQSWFITDNTRNVSNSGDTLFLAADTSGAEQSSAFNDVDFGDTGFTLQSSGNLTNGSGVTYIYAAFADTREAAFWLDQSGNDNDWQPVNLDHNDTVSDSPTDNFCTMSPIAVRDNGTKATLSDGNLNVDLGTPITSVAHTYGTMAIPSSGQFFFEATFSDVSGGPRIGISVQRTTGNQSRYVYISSGQKIVNTTSSSYGDSFAAGDTIGVAVDVDGSTIEFFKNGTSQGSFSIDLSLSTGGSSNDYFPFVTNGSGSSKSVVDFNFGQQPFKYDPPA